MNRSVRAVLSLLVLVAGATLAQAEEIPHSPAPAFVPRTNCVCPPYCQKELPCVRWDWKFGCDEYCKKPLPCLPCLDFKWLCDDYVCKPLPHCYPKAPCPPR